MKLVSALCEDNKKNSSTCRQFKSPTKLQNRSFEIVDWRKTGREMHLIKKMQLQSVQNCLFLTLNLEIYDVLGPLVVMVTSWDFMGDLKVSCLKLKQKKTKTALSNRT